MVIFNDFIHLYDSHYEDCHNTQINPLDDKPYTKVQQEGCFTWNIYTTWTVSLSRNCRLTQSTDIACLFY